MTKKIILTAILAIALVLGMTVVGCDDGSTDDNVPQTAQYEGKDAVGNTYILTITEKAGKAAYTPAAGDSYVLIIKMSGQPDKKSSGTITIVSADGTFTLQPSVEGAVTFSITISDKKISSVVWTIAVEKGETVTPRSFDTIYLRARRHTNDGGKGEDWTSGRDIKLSDFFTDTLKTDTNYKVKISGTVDKKLEHLEIQFMRIWDNGNWKWIGATNQISISGTIDNSYNVRIDDKDALVENSGEIIVSLTNIISWISTNGGEVNYGSIPEDIPNGTVMAAISNFKISLVEENGDEPGGQEPGGQGTGGNNPQTFTSIAAMAEWLSTQPAKTELNIKLNVSNLGGDSNTSGSAGATLIANNTKDVNLDLSGSTFTSIGESAFSSCYTLHSITIPNNVTGKRKIGHFI